MANHTTTADKQPGEIALDALNAISTLKASRKEHTSEHDERIRKLDELLRTLQAGVHNAELFKINDVVSPEITRLLSDPLHGF